MIEGITVLNQTEIMCSPTSAIVLGVILLCTAFVAVAVGAFCDNIVCFIIGIVILIGGFMMMIIPSESTGRYRYECVIDESIDFIDVHDKYKVVEQRGKIWVLEDKKVED